MLSSGTGSTREPKQLHWLTPRCVVCALAPGDPLCDGCAADFFAADVARCDCCAARTESAARLCGQCAAHPPHFDGTTALADYAAPVAGMVAALKFGARIDLAEAFAKLLAQRETEAAGALIVAVPLAFERQRERGFNQSLEIARRYARHVDAKLPPAPLLRLRHDPPQQSLARDARRRNVRGAFGLADAAAAALLRDRTLMVVDDVMTTGSTLDEIAATLKKAGAARVLNRVVARTP